MKTPKTKPKKDKTYHSSRPDLDNLIKMVCDVCNGILYTDDAIICKIIAYKVYDYNPRTEFSLREVE